MKLKLLSAFLILFAILVVVLANTGNFPYVIWRIYSFPFGDKLGHLVLMGALSFVLSWTALDGRPPEEVVPRIWRVGLILTVVATLEELTQQFFPERTLSFLDVMFSYAGIFVGGFYVWRMKMRQKPDSE